MTGPLSGLKAIDFSSFVAGPSCGLHLAQAGAEVTRIDHLGGPPDLHRWPLGETGQSYFWEGLNRQKKSVALDMRSKEGRRLARELVASPATCDGIVISNQQPEGPFGYAALREVRPDLIHLQLMGWGDGRTAVDYTINPAFGIPDMTGPEDRAEPVNHVLPAWDLLAGAYGAFAVLAAERRRAATGEGREIRLPLAELAASTLANLGQVAEALTKGDRPRYGNNVYGALGRDFVCATGERVMVVAITDRQWRVAVAALALEEEIAALEQRLGLDLSASQGVRFENREAINALLQQRIGALSHAALAKLFDRRGVCWSTYRTMRRALAEDPIFTEAHGLFRPVEHPSGLTYPTAAAPTARPHADLPHAELPEPQPASTFGADTEAVLSRLGLSADEIARLRADGVIG